jgi:AraC-like DNA-binding protein
MRKISLHAPRPTYLDKTKIVLSALRRLTYAQAQRKLPNFGFTMAQIAEEAGYARSSRFMDTLHCMTDDGMIDKQEWSIPGTVYEKRFVFRLPASVKQTTFIQEK